jgi:2-keto-3-deoxy-L-rhamnonate aldolase RhmA
MLPHIGYKAAPIPEVIALGNAQLSTVIVIIESPEVVSNVDAIAAVEGVDVVLIGTNPIHRAGSSGGL